MDVMYYNFTPHLPKPWNRIHPYQLTAVKKLCENGFSPDVEAVHLFGSSLDLTCHIHSDLDLYVITSNPDVFATYEQVYTLCLPLKKPFDILVASPDDYREYQDKKGSVEWKVLNEGICIYAKQADNIAG